MAVVSNLTSSLVKGDSTSAKKKFRFKAFIGVSLVDGDSTIQLICKNIYLQTQIMELKMDARSCGNLRARRQVSKFEFFILERLRNDNISNPFLIDRNM